MGYCTDCPLGPNSTGEECLDHTERKERLVMLAASQVPVACHYDVDTESATQMLLSGKDWRLDSKVRTPCFGTVCNTPGVRK